MFNAEERYYINDEVAKYTIKAKGSTSFSLVNDVDTKIDVSKGIFRKLTPRECLSLMGFDKSFKIVVPDTACYKQSGNSIVVNVLMAILKQIDITKYGI